MITEKEPNPPLWPTSVHIFRETDDVAKMQSELLSTQDPWVNFGDDDMTVAAAAAVNKKTNGSFTCDHHFARKRTALLFAPGTYHNLDVQIGYYVQLAGLGTSADDVQFVGGRGPYVPALNKHLHKRRNVKNHGTEEEAEVDEAVGTCLDSFWRCAENFAVRNNDHLQWAVSQAAPLRRVHVMAGDVRLHDGAAYASGGHLANVQIDDGTLYAGSQQQYLFRNVHLGGGTVGGTWSMVYVGCTGRVPEPQAGCPAGAATVTVVNEPRVRMEKPFIAMKNDHNEFVLRVPQVAYPGDAAYTLEPLLSGRGDDVRDFTQVRVVREDDTVSNIQDALDEGKDVVLAPGIYALEKPLELRLRGQVLLGLGLATLEAPRDGKPCIRVAAGVPGVRIAGIMLEATENDQYDNVGNAKSTLLQWGVKGRYDPGRRDDPGAMFDVFVRVGGATAGNRTNFAVDAMMQIHSSNVVCDNLWLWRADHAVLGPNEESNYPHISPAFWQSEQHEYRAETGIEVTGDDVTMFGLAVEHANGHQTVWSGERGAVHFYQCEFPYGVTRDFADNEFRGYLVMDHVNEHDLHAPGIYSNFRNEPVFVSTAIEHPVKPGVRVINPFTVKLDNHGGILTVANGRGPATEIRGVPVQLA